MFVRKKCMFDVYFKNVLNIFMKTSILTIFDKNQLKIDSIFDSLDENLENSVVQIFPKLFEDSRGWFSQISQGDHSGIKQMNRSCSIPGVMRGFHAQMSPYCQGKLVEALDVDIYDIIIDARSDSRSFGVLGAYHLDPLKQNKLWVPRGFLHGFVVFPDVEAKNACFNYFCDNIYDKKSEICINPTSVFKKLQTNIKNLDPIMLKILQYVNDGIVKLSEKDQNGLDYESWMENVKENNVLWYKTTSQND